MVACTSVAIAARQEVSLLADIFESVPLGAAMEVVCAVLHLERCWEDVGASVRAIMIEYSLNVFLQGRLVDVLRAGRVREMDGGLALDEDVGVPGGERFGRLGVGLWRRVVYEHCSTLR